MIYVITNYIANEPNFVCPDQATIDDGKAKGFIGIYSIGTQANADQILVDNAQAWLNQNISLFTTNKDIDPDPIQTTWLVCNLNTEPENTDVDYNIFDVVNGFYTTVTGLDNAKAMETEKQQNWLEFCGLTSYQSWESFPVLPKTDSSKTMGTQII